MKKTKGKTMVEKFVEMEVKDPQVVEAYTALNDLLREMAEEASFSLRVRRKMVHGTINRLMKLYW